MKLSTKLAVSIATGIVGLIAVSTVALHQIDRIHDTTVALAEVYFPAVSTLDNLRVDFVELKAIALEMIVESHDREMLAVLDKEFLETKHHLDETLARYRERPVSGDREQKIVKTIDQLMGNAVASLFSVAQAVRQHDLRVARIVWHQADELGDQLYDALTLASQFNNALVGQGRRDADEAHSAALMSALMTSGLVILLMGGIASWAYRGLVGSIRVLEHKLNEIGNSLDLGKRVDLGSSEEMKRATLAINRLLERAHGGYIDMMAKHDEASHSARHDPLTGLPNRMFAGEILAEAIVHARHADKKLALMFIDLDGFKAVNDSYGHDAGDFLLQEVARRLRGAMRGEDTAARLGGDEFLALLGGLGEADSVARIARKIIDQIAAGIEYEGRSMNVGASIGIALFPDHGTDAHVLLQAADSAMYEVKRSGKNGYRFYRPVPPVAEN